MDKVRFAMIGAGSMANKAHYPSLNKIADAEIVALCDLIPEKAQETAKRWGVPKVYQDYRTMLDENAVDGVYCIMPPHHLFDVAMDILARGRHLFIEKPPGITTYQTEALARQAERYGCITLVGLNRQHSPVLRFAREYMNEHGPVTQVVATFFKEKDAAFFAGALSALHSDTIHCVDAMRYLAGSDATQVHSIVSSFADEVPNSWNAVMRFENGAAGVLLSNYRPGTRIHRFEVHGERRSLLLDHVKGGRLYENDKLVREFTPKDLAPDEDADGFLHQAREFVRCIKSGTQPRSNFRDAVKTMALCDAINAG